MIGPVESEAGPIARAKTANFDHLARIYRWMEYATFGPYLASCRFTFLSEVATCRRALVIGDGDGRFTAELLRVNRSVEIEAVDASQAMLDALLRHAGVQAARVNAYCVDVRNWRPVNAPYDLVVTHFFLDCLSTDEVCAMAKKLQDVLLWNARWIISEFTVPHSPLGRFVARPIVWLLYRAFRILTGLRVQCLPAYGDALESCGFSLLRTRTLLGGLVSGELWSWGDGRVQNPDITFLLKS